MEVNGIELCLQYKCIIPQMFTHVIQAFDEMHSAFEDNEQPDVEEPENQTQNLLPSKL